MHKITKDAVQSTAFLLHIAEDPKGKALSEASARCVVANPADTNFRCRADAVKDEQSEVNHKLEEQKSRTPILFYSFRDS